MSLGGRSLLARATVGIALVLAAATVVTGLWLRSADAGAGQRCAAFQTGSEQRAALVTGSGDDVLVVGDSWSAGLGLADLRDSWPTRLPGRVHVAGFSGSGFSPRASECGDRSFGRRVAGALTPATDLVVVEGGLNDHDRTDAEIRSGFASLVAALADRPDLRVVVVGPAAAPSRAEAVRRVDALLAQLTSAAGWDYVAAYGWELDYLPDRLHLTPEGHAVFGDLVARAVDQAVTGRS